jgi:hypothetical protein
MPPDPDEAASDAHQLRHDLLSSLAIVSGQTQLLQRQLRRMDGFSDGDRERLETGLEVILTAARALGTRIEDLPGLRDARDET